MRKIFLAALLFTSIVPTTDISAAGKIDNSARKSFSSAFAPANHNWSLKTPFTKVDVEVEGKNLSTYYDFSGELIGTTEEISLEELPVDAKRSFAKRYSGYTVTEVLKFESPEETAYYLSAENGKGSEIVKISNANEASFFKKMKD